MSFLGKTKVMTEAQILDLYLSGVASGVATYSSSHGASDSVAIGNGRAYLAQLTSAIVEDPATRDQVFDGIRRILAGENFNTAPFQMGSRDD